MSNASRLVEKLKIKGLLKREECPTDRRQVDILITEKGLALLAKLESEVMEFNKKFVKLSDADVSKLNQLLDDCGDW